MVPRSALPHPKKHHRQPLPCSLKPSFLPCYSAAATESIIGGLTQSRIGSLCLAHQRLDKWTAMCREDYAFLWFGYYFFLVRPSLAQAVKESHLEVVADWNSDQNSWRRDCAFTRQFGSLIGVFRLRVLLPNSQVLSWGLLALIPVAGEALPILLACVLLSNLGAYIAEVAKDALVAEYGQNNKMTGLQSYAFMALSAGGILGNLLGGFFLLQTQQPKSMFLSFATLLALQLTITLAVREESLGLAQTSNHSFMRKSISESISKKYSDLLGVAREESISRPLIWIVASTATVPILSGSIFCYQTQCLNLDPSVIGMSKVIGQLMLLVMTVLYDRLWKVVPMRKLIGIAQIFCASSLFLTLYW